MDAASHQSTKSEINKLTSSHLEVQDPGQAAFNSRDNYSIRAGKAVPLQCDSRVSHAHDSVRTQRRVSPKQVPSKSQVSPIFCRTRMGDRREKGDTQVNSGRVR